MAQDEAKEKLVALLDEKVFTPVLGRSPDDFPSDNQKGEFQDLKESLGAQQHRFHHQYKTAEAVRENCQYDLISEAGRRVSGEAQNLGLPDLREVRDELLALCEELGVR